MEDFDVIEEHKKEMKRRGFYDSTPEDREERLMKSFNDFDALLKKIKEDADKYAQEVNKGEQ